MLSEGAAQYLALSPHLQLSPQIADDAAVARANTEELLRLFHSQNPGVPIATLRAILANMGS